MRFFKHFLIPLLLFAISCSLSACDNTLELDGGYKASFVGHMVELNGEYAPLTDIYPGENYLTLYDDGNGVIAFSGYEEKITWTKNGDSYSILFENEPCPATITNGIAVVEIDGANVTYVAENATAPVIPTAEAPNYDTNPYVEYGSYQGLTISYENEVYTMTEFYKGPCSIRLDVNGMGVLILGGSEQTIAWEVDADVLTIADETGMNSFGILSDGVIVLDYKETGVQLAFAKEGSEP